MKKYRYCKRCKAKIFELLPTKQFYGLITYQEKTIKEWYFKKDGYYCMNCYKILDKKEV